MVEGGCDAGSEEARGKVLPQESQILTWPPGLGCRSCRAVAGADPTHSWMALRQLGTLT